MTDAVQLAQRWAVGAQIGKGGFGRVFEATGQDGRLAAIKFIPKEPGADRELLFENLATIRNIVPIIDSGQWKGYWILVMPRATKSLRDHHTNRLPPEEVVRVLTDVVTCLADLRGRAVHRDIKPENVLLLDGRWCLSDFGIARYAEASTAADTKKWAWTPPYNPPERWRGDRATPASDIYSLGVMAFEMASGRWPFPGPDFRQQHLTEDPPRLTGCPSLLAALVTECLFKAPEVRPTPANLLARLAIVLQPASPAAARLRAANQAQVERLASEAAQASAARSEGEHRAAVVDGARQVLELIADRLLETIRENAPGAIVEPAPAASALGGWSAKLGQAKLALSAVRSSYDGAWGRWAPKFQVIAYADIEIRFPEDQYQYEGRAHSLWFCDAQEPGAFRWYETAFMIHPLFPRRARQTPFALPPSEEAGKAVSPGMAEFAVAWPFTPIESGKEADFLERWLDWFAKAAHGELGYPSSMPERNPNGSWRR